MFLAPQSSSSELSAPICARSSTRSSWALLLLAELLILVKKIFRRIHAQRVHLSKIFLKDFHGLPDFQWCLGMRAGRGKCSKGPTFVRAFVCPCWMKHLWQLARCHSAVKKNWQLVGESPGAEGRTEERWALAPRLIRALAWCWHWHQPAQIGQPLRNEHLAALGPVEQCLRQVGLRFFEKNNGMELEHHFTLEWGEHLLTLRNC